MTKKEYWNKNKGTSNIFPAVCERCHKKIWEFIVETTEEEGQVLECEKCWMRNGDYEM